MGADHFGGGAEGRWPTIDPVYHQMSQCLIKGVITSQGVTGESTVWPCPTLTRSVEVIWGKMWVEGKDFKDFSDLMKVQLGQPYVLRDFFTCVRSFSWFFKLLRLPWPGWGPTQTHWFYTLNPISLTWEKCCTTYFVINLDFVIGGTLPWNLDLKLCMSTV